MFTSTKTLLTSALAAAVPASAYITAMSVPDSSSSVAAGSSVPVTFTTGIYIQNWSDLGAVWGIQPVSDSSKFKRADDVYVGTMVDYTDLYKKGVEPEEPGNFTVKVKIPEDTNAGEYTLTAGVSFLVGASGLTQVQSWNDTITVTKA